MKTFGEYEERAMALEMKTLTPRELALKSGLGLAGEAGETVELVKKWAFHDRPLDRAKLTKELGDVLWYLTALARTQGITLEEVASENVAKLEARYPTGIYSHEANHARVDEKPAFKSAVFCEHANEVPYKSGPRCECAPDCACRERMCKPGC
jgi:NTP pyrophosphatase (non-canonical NTP hydrolase)